MYGRIVNEEAGWIKRDDLNPCPECGEHPKMRTYKKDIPEADKLFPAAGLACKCKSIEAVGVEEKDAVETAEYIWKKRVTKEIK